MIRPMLAETIEVSDFNKLNYPVLASVKLDGIRCIATNEGAYSRSGKLIPNKFIQKYITDVMINLCNETKQDIILDGELLVGETFQSCTSGIMSFEGEPNFTYNVFDCVIDYQFDLEAINRAINTNRILQQTKSFRFMLLPQMVMTDIKLLEQHYNFCILKGYEGIIVRGYNSPYKQGRSTKKEQYLLKVKPFETAEAMITDLVEKEHNNNEKEIDELGFTKRSSAKDGMVGMNTLGAFVCMDIKTNVKFNIGTGLGLNDELRSKIWNNQRDYIGKIITYKTQKIGTLDKPRIPVFIGFRDKEDM